MVVYLQSCSINFQLDFKLFHKIVEVEANPGEPLFA
jgi:glutathione peroxidase-family protein